MHEMSLAMSVLDIIERTMKSYPERRLGGVELTVGELSGVDLETFTTAINAVLRSSLWPEATPLITKVSGKVGCISCGNVFPSSSIASICPRCGSGMCSVVEGTDFRVVSLRIVD